MYGCYFLAAAGAAVGAEVGAVAEAAEFIAFRLLERIVSTAALTSVISFLDSGKVQRDRAPPRSNHPNACISAGSIFTSSE